MKTTRGALKGPVLTTLPALSDPAAFCMVGSGTDLMVSINGGPYVGLGAGTGVPGGPADSVQFNAAGVFGGSAAFTFDGTNVTLTSALFADAGVDVSAPGLLLLGATNATLIIMGKAGVPVRCDGGYDAENAVSLSVGGTRATDVALGGPAIPTAAGGTFSVFDTTTLQSALVMDGGIAPADIQQAERVGDPGAVANAGTTYTKDDAGTTQLFFQDSAGAVHQLTPAAGGSPGGSPNDVQFNNAGAFDGDSSFAFDGSNVTIANELFLGGDVTFSNTVAHRVDIADTAAGTVGRALTVTSGGTALNAIGNGATAGEFFANAARGGDTTSVGNFGGAGGAKRSHGGIGGSADQATSGGGFGGAWTGGGGAGGNGTNGANGGNGATANLSGGAGGAAAGGGVGGSGGGVFVIGGVGVNGGNGADVTIEGGGGAVDGDVNIGGGSTRQVDIGNGATNPPINILGGTFTVGGPFVHTGAAAADTFEVTAPVNVNQAVAILGATGEEFFLVDTLGGDEIKIGSAGVTDPTISIGSTGSFIGFFGQANFGGIPNAYTVTNPVDRRTFDTTTVTLAQLAEVVGTIIADHQSWNLFQ